MFSSSEKDWQKTLTPLETTATVKNKAGSQESRSVKLPDDGPVPDRNQVFRSTSHISGPDTIEPPEPELAYAQDEENEVYGKWTGRRKAVIVAIMSFCALLSPISSTSVLAATPQVAADYHTTGSIVDISNSGYMVFMSLAPIAWAPVSQVFGRRPVRKCCLKRTEDGSARLPQMNSRTNLHTRSPWQLPSCSSY